MVTYKDIPNHPGYRVGDDGSVWSRHKGRWGVGSSWRRLRPGTNNKYGRQIASLGRSSGSLYVHHLVLLAFVGPCPEGMECLHANGNAGDNRLANLSWGLPKANDADMRIHGKKKGERHHNATITDAVVRVIRRRVLTGESHQAIADSLGVQRRNVGRIADRTRWSHVV